jgi:uncharacterized protein (DUF1697 family)
MTAYAALLRAINVGGTGKLAMSELVELCEDAGFTSVKTYIQSGNVVFASRLGEARVQAVLAKALAAKLGKPVGVLVRTAPELEGVLAANPFPRAPPNRVIVFFLPEPPGALAVAKGPSGEELVLRGREIFVHYPVGQGVSKLKVPHAAVGTGRNLNTVAKLAAMAGAIAAK